MCVQVFQVIQKSRALYIQANNCVEEKEWRTILTRICHFNLCRIHTYHPAAFLKGHWLWSVQLPPLELVWLLACVCLLCVLCTSGFPPPQIQRILSLHVGFWGLQQLTTFDLGFPAVSVYLPCLRSARHVATWSRA